jgi:hypothetical protein
MAKIGSPTKQPKKDPFHMYSLQRCGTGTGTVTCVKVRTGIVINYGSGTGTRYKIIIHLEIFSFTFYNKFVELFLEKQLKRQKKIQIFFEKLAFYGLDMELEPEPEP